MLVRGILWLFAMGVIALAIWAPFTVPILADPPTIGLLK